MPTQDERKSLMANPLPPEINIVVVDYVTNCPADRVLTHILDIDDEVEKIEAALRPYLTSLASQRKQLLDRAKAENINEDAVAVLVTKEGKKMRNKITDNEAFELAFPTEYRMIRDAQKVEIESKHTLALERIESSEIPLTLADDKVGKKIVTEFVGYQPVAVSYEVQRKTGC